MELTDKQWHILEVAERLFADKGFDGTSIRDIAKEADINIAMISYYFGSKEKMLEALFDKRAQETTLKLETLIHDESISYIEKMQRVVETYVDKTTRQPCFHRIMMRQQVADSDGVIWEQILAIKKNSHALIKKLVHEGQKKGEFKKNIDISLTLATLFGTVSHMITSQRFYREINNLQDMPEEEFQKHLKKKLNQHLKSLFKALLTYEDQ